MTHSPDYQEGCRESVVRGRLPRRRLHRPGVNGTVVHRQEKPEEIGYHRWEKVSHTQAVDNPIPGKKNDR